MLPGFSGYAAGNGYYSPCTEEVPRFRHCNSFRASYDNVSSSSPPSPAHQPQAERTSSSKQEYFDDAYFDSYSQIGIHEEMIKDRVRTETYRNAILKHQNSIEGKVVMDVGCGTGILSIFCAFAGARRVYAIEASDIAVQAIEVVKANNLDDKVIVIHEKVEKVNIQEKVDVIISEWMGYMLLYESMLKSVIFARDNWLKQGGLILPSHATLYMAPVTHNERYRESIDFWRDVYGINMSVMLPLAKQCAFEEPCIEAISAENVLTWPFVVCILLSKLVDSHCQRLTLCTMASNKSELKVKFIDCYTVAAHELESITADYTFTSMLRAPLHGFAFWFDAEFNGDQKGRRKRPKSDQDLVLSTAPEDQQTHWQQTVVYLYEPIEVSQDQMIEGSVILSQSIENPRFMNIHIEYRSGGRSFIKESILR